MCLAGLHYRGKSLDNEKWGDFLNFTGLREVHVTDNLNFVKNLLKLNLFPVSKPVYRLVCKADYAKKIPYAVNFNIVFLESF